MTVNAIDLRKNTVSAMSPRRKPGSITCSKNWIPASAGMTYKTLVIG
jgi:hypothetical protein